MPVERTILGTAFSGRYAVSIDDEKKIWFETERSPSGGSRHTANINDLIELAQMITEATAKLYMREDPPLDRLATLLTVSQSLRQLTNDDRR